LLDLRSSYLDLIKFGIVLIFKKQPFQTPMFHWAVGTIAQKEGHEPKDVLMSKAND
jgi:hypothetical protein